MSIAASSKSIRNILLRFGFLVVFALFFGFFAAWNPLFLQGENLTNIVEGSAILMIVAIAMTLIVATGGIDLSIGIALDFGAAFAIVAMKSYGLDWLGAACLGVTVARSWECLTRYWLSVCVLARFSRPSALFLLDHPFNAFSPMAEAQSRFAVCLQNFGILRRANYSAFRSR